MYFYACTYDIYMYNMYVHIMYHICRYCSYICRWAAFFVVVVKKTRVAEPILICRKNLHPRIRQASWVNNLRYLPAPVASLAYHEAITSFATPEAAHATIVLIDILLITRLRPPF